MITVAGAIDVLEKSALDGQGNVILPCEGLNQILELLRVGHEIVEHDLPSSPGRGRIHILKTWPPYFQQVQSGTKSFEVRLNDRNFIVGDTLILQEYIPENWCVGGPRPKNGYTGAQVFMRVMSILHGPSFGIHSGYVVMGIRPASIP